MIWYFSPTGTSRRAAEALGEETYSLTTPEERSRAPRPEPGGRFTLVFPVHGQRVPVPLRRWLAALPRRSAKAILICTYGSVNAGGVLAEAAGLAGRRGMTVVAAAELPGPHSYAMARTKRDLTGGGETDLAALRAFYEQAKERSAPISITPRWDPARLLPDRLAPVRLAVRPPMPDPRRCRGCGACQAVCPGDGGDCIRCGACVKACPAGARTLDFMTQVPAWFLSKTIKKRQPRFI